MTHLDLSVTGILAPPEGYIVCPGLLPEDMVWVREESLEGLAVIQALIFDMDGVVLDSRGSIDSAHPIAISFWASQYRGLADTDSMVDSNDLGVFKLYSGFNDDWNIASAVALIYSVKSEWLGLKNGSQLRLASPVFTDILEPASQLGSGVDGVKLWLEQNAPKEAFSEGVANWDGDLVMKIFMEVISGPNCQEMYGFEATHYSGSGTILQDRLLVPEDVLKSLPWKVAVYTGRTFGEAKVGLRIVGMPNWVPDHLLFSVDEDMPKPDGRPLGILMERLDATIGAFIGDNRDDMNSVLQYRKDGGKKPVYSVSVCFSTNPDKVRELFVEGGSDLIAPDSTAALKALRHLSGN